MKFGYARVSGLSQDLAQQKEQLVKNGVDEDNIYAEVNPHSWTKIQLWGFYYD